MHPHGVLYQKDSEGADYNDGTGGPDKEDGCVAPGSTHTYTSADSLTVLGQAHPTPVRSSGFTTRIATSCATSPQG